MRRLSFIIFLFIACFEAYGQSPHGTELKLDCTACHNTSGWEIPSSEWKFVPIEEKQISKTTGLELQTASSKFNHFDTDFPLLESHEEVDCKACHETLIFDQAQTDCISCHTDVHSSSVGNDCIRCHTSSTWLVDNIPELHEANGFPLTGAHNAQNCVDCHKSETQLRFDPIGNECLSCHLPDYNEAKIPDHVAGNFSQNCIECHDPSSTTWNTDIVDHDFFPLTLGHEIQDCKQCHLTDNYSDASPDCISCHQSDFNETEEPNHVLAGFPTECISCHSTDPGWAPAEFTAHDNEFFPIYSGSHDGVWEDCASCHTEQGNLSVFACITCHGNPETDNEHREISAYAYEDNACLACHPNGDSESAFDHNSTNFPLTGAHIGAECLQCHSDGFEGTSGSCIDCHTLDFEATKDPDHQDLGIPTDCASCHTTDPEWSPASFDMHNEFYVLKGAHALIANDCKACHDNGFESTPHTCVACHQDNYENTNSPNHTSTGFSTECAVCHSEDSWIPASFDHDEAFFPIYSGTHEGEWSECIDCHTTANNFGVFSCTNCHTNPENDNEHEGVSGYVYSDNACLACHPTGNTDDAFDHNATNFPLTGEHIGVNCLECHANGYVGTSTNCVDCHNTDFQDAKIPNHLELNFPTDCASCHTTDPDWRPATFDIHNDFYALKGAHAAIAINCIACHLEGYDNTPNTCVGCHQENYDNTIDPNHSAAHFSTDCVTCHGEDSWVPSTFDHDAQYFPIYSGDHEGTWTECLDCHTNPNNFTEVSCVTCHSNSETDNEHADINGYVYSSNACLACHPSGNADDVFNHDATNFPLTGEHIGVNCLVCHADGYAGTSTSCVDCHNTDFQSAANPNHTELHFPTDCASCHTTDPEWKPASFGIHDDFYPLIGAHAAIATDCISCHADGYANTPNNCAGCHIDDYNNTSFPNHTAAQFSTDCATCHNENAWDPSTFDHDSQYFPINSGTHNGVWSNCVECHNDPNNFSQFTCISCHINPETDDEHNGVSGYSYENQACFACHPTGEKENAFDHNTTNFPLTGEHVGLECLQCHADGYVGTSTNCVDCHNSDFQGTSNPNHNNLNISTDCASCHTTEPDWMPAAFVNHDDFYALMGAHSAIANDCVACHNGDYNNTPSTCVGCHQIDFNNTSNPNHIDAQFPTDCATCHSENTWSPSTFDHNAIYPLNGAHAAVANDCIACHSEGYSNTPNTCVACHQTDYENTSNPNHADAHFSTECITCHSENAWQPANFDHDAQYFPIYSGAHNGEWTECIDCHMNANNFAEVSCTNCHVNPQTDNDHSAVSGYVFESAACLACHPTGSAADAFDHNSTNFPLTGEHIGLDCLQCHADGYVGTSTNCVDCHNADFQGTTNPNHVVLNIPTDCIACHTTDPEWMPSNFAIHNDFYVLNGAHAAIANDCVECHNGDYNNTPNTCVGCHQTDYNNTTNPDHIDAQFPTDCATCHSENTWSPSTFDHNAIYPLNSAHAAVANDCIACHSEGYSNTSNTCVACHQTDFDNTTNPNHADAHFSTECMTCHTENAWQPANFDHDAQYFPIYSGAHNGEWTECIDCHMNANNFTEVSCTNCHVNPQTDNDHSAVSGYVFESAACLACHPTGSAGDAFDHNSTNFPLTGEHIGLDCLQCHANGYAGTSSNCVDCHNADFQGSTNPSHVVLNIPNDCIACHTTDPDWMPAAFDIHDNYYTLNGAHAAIANDCIECHNGDYNNTPSTCVGCHQTDFNNTTNPNHTDAQFPTDCATCHSESAWEPSNFDHNTIYALDGAHATIANDCIQCHDDGYVNTPNTCVGCHQTDYNNTTNPNHTDAQFPTDCATCHSESAWEPSTFDHNTIYALNGAHLTIANNCIQCHSDGYVNTPNTCVGCHQTDFDNTTNPDHADAQFPTDCATCHSESAWEPSNFDHNTIYALNGAHATIANDCVQCHSDGYVNTPNTCVGCHQSDYDNANNPDHSTAQFPTDCTACHSENAWEPSTFDHDGMYFPIYSGKHQQAWNDCMDCHMVTSDYSIFSCIDCHEHNNQNDVDADHSEVNGYLYTSLKCLECHPTGDN